MANKFLIHAYKDPDPSVQFLTVHLDDKVFRLYPGEPIEIDNDSNGRRLDNPDFYAHHIVATFGSIYGIVEVPTTKTRSGVTFDVDRAMEMAEASLLQNRYRHINNWATDQLQSRVRQNLPVLPPTGFVEESIRVLNVDTQKKYGFRPIGWDWRPEDTRPVDSAPVALALDSNLAQENADLKSRLARLEEALGITAPAPALTAPPTKASAKAGK